VAAVALVVAATEQAASRTFVPCHGSSGVLCGTVSVQLDPSGTVPGSVPLAVEELPADGKPRGVMALLAGGPGQASDRPAGGPRGDPAGGERHRQGELDAAEVTPRRR